MTEVKAELVGNLWKIVVEVGQAVEEDDTLMILELMKMEIPITSPTVGHGHPDPRRRGRGGPGGPDGRHRRLILAVTVPRRSWRAAVAVRR